MSELPQNQDSPDDAQFDAEIMASMLDGFTQLETPAPVTQIERSVKKELTSGIDFDPLPRQIGRRIIWTAIPAVAAFMFTAGALAIRPVPRIPFTRWLITHGDELKKPDVSNAITLYQVPPPLPPLTDSGSGYSTQVKGTEAPDWFRKEVRKPNSHSRSGRPYSPVMGSPSILRGPGVFDGSGIVGSPSTFDGPNIMGGFSGVSGVTKK